MEGPLSGAVKALQRSCGIVLALDMASATRCKDLEGYAKDYTRRGSWVLNMILPESLLGDGTVGSICPQYRTL